MPLPLTRLWPLALLLSASAQEPDPGFAAEHAQCQAAEPRSPAAARCQRRLPWLDARRDADGSFASLEALEAVRRGYAARPPAESAARVAAIYAAEGAAEQVRLEAAAWLAREHLERRADPAAALAWTAPLWAAAQAGAGDALVRRQAADLHARALAELGRTADAEAVEAAADPARAARPAEGLPLLLRQQRRQALARASGAILAAFGLLALPLAARAGRPWPPPRGLLVLGLALAPFAAVAGLREPASAPAFGALLAALAGVHLLAAYGGRGLRGPWQRGCWGALAALASLAAAYLALYASDRLEDVLL